MNGQMAKQARRFLDGVLTPSTLVAENCELIGNVSASGAFILNGSITGDGDIKGVLHINSTGVWTGNIRAENIVIEGKVVGNVYASGKLEVGASAVVEGTISGCRVSVNKGADVHGEMKVAGNADVQFFEEKRNRTSVA